MNSKPVVQSANLLDELQSALAHGTVARRVETLRRVTDLFLHAADDYSDEQIDLFDDVFHCLIQEIEAAAKARLAVRLAPVSKAPPKLMYTLAFEDLIEVAAPVLSQSERLDDATLIENARSKSQEHMLAISKRRILSGAVTDVLIELGDTVVVKSAVNNPGAEFSDKGFSQLVDRASDNDNLATCLGNKRDIPRPHYLKLIARASDAVRARLEADNSQWVDDISTAVSEAALEAYNRPAQRAQTLVRSLYDDGRLDENQIAAFADMGKIDETNAALAVCANVPLESVETMMRDSRIEGLMVLAKVAGLSWPSLKTILAIQRGMTNIDADALEQHKSSYEMLRMSTAQQVLRFYRMRQDTAGAAAT